MESDHQGKCQKAPLRTCLLGVSRHYKVGEEGRENMKNSEMDFKIFGGFMCDANGLYEFCGKDPGPTGFHLEERTTTFH